MAGVWTVWRGKLLDLCFFLQNPLGTIIDPSFSASASPHTLAALSDKIQDPHVMFGTYILLLI